MAPPPIPQKRPFGRDDLMALCALAISPQIVPRPADEVRVVHLCHLGSMLLAPTHPRAAANLREVVAHLSGTTLSSVPASWVMRTYRITDLASLRAAVVLNIGAEDRHPCVVQLEQQTSGALMINLDLPAGRGLLTYLEVLEKSLGLSEFQRVNGLDNVPLFLTGGLAAHLYTGIHPVYAIEGEFGAAIPCPAGLVVDLVDEDGMPQVAYLDLSVATEKGLWHPDIHQCSFSIDVGVKGFDLTVPRPIDLAVNMCTNLSQSEGLWIDDMARRHLFTAEEFSDHAAQALLECELEDAEIKRIEHHVELAAAIVARAHKPGTPAAGSTRKPR